MARKVILTRAHKKPDMTIGMLDIVGVDHKPIMTLELPDRGNKRNISCIPKGKYNCKIYWSGRFPLAYEVQKVRGRSNILIHPGNLVTEIEGCILLGMALGKLFIKDDADTAVLQSTIALRYLKSMVGDNFILKIK